MACRNVDARPERFKPGGGTKFSPDYVSIIEMINLECDMHLTKREEALISYIRLMDKSKRHVLTVVCRGTEPWEIEEHVAKTKIDLHPVSDRNKR